jgi:rubrerythrin
MIAQKMIINDAVVTGDEATVQAAVELLTQKPTIPIYRWVCEVCGMIHTGTKPVACDSCGSDVSLAPLTNFRSEICSRW